MVGAPGFAAHGVFTNADWRVDSSPTVRSGFRALQEKRSFMAKIAMASANVIAFAMTIGQAPTSKP